MTPFRATYGTMKKCRIAALFFALEKIILRGCKRVGE